MADIVIIGDINPIGDAHKVLIAVILSRAHDVAAYLIFSTSDREQALALAFALHEPLAGKLGHELGNTAVGTLTVKAAYREKLLVAPHDA